MLFSVQSMSSTMYFDLGAGTEAIVNRYDILFWKSWRVGRANASRSVEEIAKKRGISMAQVALAWSFGKEGVSAPIVGTTSLENLRELIGKSFVLSRLELI